MRINVEVFVMWQSAFDPMANVLGYNWRGRT